MSGGEAEEFILQAGFPNSIFISIEHDVETDERVEFEFWYKDLRNNAADAKKSVKGFNLVTKDVKRK